MSSTSSRSRVIFSYLFSFITFISFFPFILFFSLSLFLAFISFIFSFSLVSQKRISPDHLECRAGAPCPTRAMAGFAPSRDQREWLWAGYLCPCDWVWQCKGLRYLARSEPGWRPCRKIDVHSGDDFYFFKMPFAWGGRKGMPVSQAEPKHLKERKCLPPPLTRYRYHSQHKSV